MRAVGLACLVALASGIKTSPVYGHGAIDKQVGAEELMKNFAAKIFEGPAVARNTTASGITLKRAWNFDSSFGTAAFTVTQDGEQCVLEEADSFGQTNCHFNWGDKVDMNLAWNRSEITEGTKLKIKMDITPGGAASVFKVDPISIDCMMCGANCLVDIPKINEMAVMPTEDDAAGIPIFGPAIIAFMNVSGYPLPKTRALLAEKINTYGKLATFMLPGVFDATAFANESTWVDIGETQIRIPMPACPMSQLALPMKLSTPANSFGIRASIDTESVGLKAKLPTTVFDYDMNLPEGNFSLSFSIENADGTILTEFSGIASMNQDVTMPTLAAAAEI